MTYRSITPEAAIRIAAMRPIEELRDRHAGQHCYIIGMGPSLLRLTRADLPDPTAVILALYESIWLMELWNLPNTLYSMQKDNITGLPNRSPLLVHYHESAIEDFKYEPVYIFDNEAGFGRNWYVNSGIISIYIAHLMGMRDFTIVSYDVSTLGDNHRAMCNPHGQVFMADYIDSCAPLKGEAEEIIQSKGGKVTWLTP